ncbi:hypothetical protein N7497_001151 [Penicillium chrysogenum]|nr:hypothetical protein N7497_001151 [Penicillium chrysogenum]
MSAYDPEWDPSPEGESAQALSSSFAAQCSLDPKTDSVVLSQPPEAKVPWADSDVKDPFLLLPWFALEEVLVHLPDLLTLHKLCRASPAVADYLYHTPGVFPMVFERMVEHLDDEFDEKGVELLNPQNFEAGVDRDTSNFFRVLVYLWWKEESAANNVPADGNPIPDTFYDEAMWLVNRTTSSWAWVPSLGTVKLPRSTPPRILRHLMTLAVRIRADAHAFFHETIALCKSCPIELIGDWDIKKTPWPKGGRRPRGTQTCTPESADYPLTWFEEQRLTQAFLKPYLFSVLRRVVYLQRLLEERPNTLQHLKDNSLLDFWRNFDEDSPRRVRKPPGENRANGTTRDGVNLDGGKQSKALQTAQAKSGIHTVLSKVRRFEPRASEAWFFHSPVLLPTWLQFCPKLHRHPHSGVQGAGLRGEFQKFGVAFWDNERMMDLSLMTKRVDRWTDQKQLAFRWSSLLLASKKKGIKITGKKRGHRFRSQTAPIPLSH